MRAISFELLGKTLLMKKLSKQNFKAPVDDSIRKITLWFHGTVKVSTPVDTGRLRSSVASTVKPRAGEVFTNVEYSPFVEYGTKTTKMEARHVKRGSSVRVLGTGPFTYALEQLQEKMGGFTKELAKGLKARFDK